MLRAWTKQLRENSKRGSAESAVTGDQQERLLGTRGKVLRGAVEVAHHSGRRSDRRPVAGSAIRMLPLLCHHTRRRQVTESVAGPFFGLQTTQFVTFATDLLFMSNSLSVFSSSLFL